MTKKKENPTPKGWRPGQSGNPGGKPKYVSILREKFLLGAEPMMARLLQLSQSRDERVALMATKEWLDRAGLTAFKLEADKVEVSGSGSLADAIVAKITALAAARRAAESDRELAAGPDRGDRESPALELTAGTTDSGVPE